MNKRKETPAFDHEGQIDVGATRDAREAPTQFTAPDSAQKWRARNVISFHFKWLRYKASPYYRDILLCIIDHANPFTGRCDIGQRKIAAECNRRRETVNRALLWWEENTRYLKVESRPGRTNAYHIQWPTLEADWHKIQELISTALDGSGTEGVTYPVTPGVTYPVTGGVTIAVTQNLKDNLKGEPQHEMGHAERGLVSEEEEKGLQENTKRRLKR